MTAMSLERARTLIALFLTLCLLTFAIACGGGDDEDDEEEGPATSTTTATKYAPSGNEGSISGTVAFQGTAPEAKPISMDADAACGAANSNPMAEDVVVKDGKVQNVFVYVKDGKLDGNKTVDSFTFDPPAEAKVLDQHGCHYEPHVLGIQTGQKLNVTNSDQTTHNVNVQGNNNPKFNQSQTAGQAPIEKTFARAETLIPVKCNQHPWMKSYIGVVKHPFYGVSGPDGRFEIKGLPAGTYTLVAWHERFGEKTQAVTVGAKESKQQDFSFAAGGTADSLSGGSLEVLPALELPMLGKH